MVDGPQGPAFLMLFDRGGEIVAFRNRCPHQGRSLNWAPDRFLISDEGWLVCAHHGACFDLSNGECVQGPCEGARLESVSISVEQDQIWINEPPKTLKT